VTGGLHVHTMRSLSSLRGIYMKAIIGNRRRSFSSQTVVHCFHKKSFLCITNWRKLWVWKWNKALQCNCLQRPPTDLFVSRLDVASVVGLTDCLTQRRRTHCTVWLRHLQSYLRQRISHIWNQCRIRGGWVLRMLQHLAYLWNRPMATEYTKTFS